MCTAVNLMKGIKKWLALIPEAAIRGKADRLKLSNKIQFPGIHTEWCTMNFVTAE